MITAVEQLDIEGVVVADHDDLMISSLVDKLNIGDSVLD